MKLFATTAIALSLSLPPLFLPLTAVAKEKVSMVLNWVPTADHSPYFYAREKGWYDEAGIDLTIENGMGSGAAAQR
ncbi:ABC transporter substrate-binding protein, partial [Acinetobacter baumannii]